MSCLRADSRRASWVEETGTRVGYDFTDGSEKQKQLRQLFGGAGDGGFGAEEVKSSFHTAGGVAHDDDK
jgi:hypothetical protein